MEKKIEVKKFLLAIVLSIAVVLSCAEAFAADRGRSDNGRRFSGYDKNSGRGKKHEVVVVGRERYNYHDGRFFRPSWFGFEFFVNTPPFGAIVMSIPIGHRAVMIGGVQYYHYNNIYYKPCPSGYIVVPPPVTVINPAPIAAGSQSVNGETVTINVPNSNGSFTPITLVRRDGGYFGPQGEYYPNNPTVEQLRVLYGR